MLARCMDDIFLRRILFHQIAMMSLLGAMSISCYFSLLTMVSGFRPGLFYRERAIRPESSPLEGFI